MKQAVLKRLGELEERYAAAANARRSEYHRERAFEWFENTLRFFNEEPVPTRQESLMDKLARCLGIRSYELRALMREDANEFKRVLVEALKKHQQLRFAR